MCEGIKKGRKFKGGLANFAMLCCLLGVSVTSFSMDEVLDIAWPWLVVACQAANSSFLVS